jgi:membrane-bound lytic murein transglycosylase MltF
MSPSDISIYDELIKKYHAQYHLPFDWTLLKAQLFAESELYPNYDSGSRKGLGQFTMELWDEYLCKCSLSHKTSRTCADAAIKCSAAYMQDLLVTWKNSEDNPLSHYNLALASYYLGLGNILKAQRIVLGSCEYKRVLSALKFVVGVENALQTTNYVSRIHSYHRSLLLATT